MLTNLPATPRTLPLSPTFSEAAQQELNKALELQQLDKEESESVMTTADKPAAAEAASMTALATSPLHFSFEPAHLSRQKKQLSIKEEDESGEPPPPPPFSAEVPPPPPNPPPLSASSGGGIMKRQKSQRSIGD